MELKFKFYNWNTREYMSKCLLDENGKVRKLNEKYGKTPMLLNVTPLMFTGLKDKAGQDIYEYDVVYDEDEEDLGRVQWDDDLGRWIVEFDDVIYSLGYGLNDRIEVVASCPTTIEDYRKENESVEDED